MSHSIIPHVQQVSNKHQVEAIITTQPMSKDDEYTVLSIHIPARDETMTLILGDNQRQILADALTSE